MGSTACASFASRTTLAWVVSKPRKRVHQTSVVRAAPGASIRRASAVTAAVSSPAGRDTAAAALEVNLADSLRPTSAECAKTLVAIADTGTLATTGEDGVALGTFASYVVTKQGGDVVLRMRADALHTLNIGRDTRCSLYVQPSTQPPGVLSRATLIGSLVKLNGDDLPLVEAQYAETHGAGVGVDGAGFGDEYYNLTVDRVFYVGGLGSDKRAEVVTTEQFGAAKADPLAKNANKIVDAMNVERYEVRVAFPKSRHNAYCPSLTSTMAVTLPVTLPVTFTSTGNGYKPTLETRG